MTAAVYASATISGHSSFSHADMSQVAEKGLVAAQQLVVGAEQYELVPSDRVQVVSGRNI